MVSILNFGARIDNSNQTDTFLVENVTEGCQIRETVLVHSEHLVVIHVVNIHMDDIAGKIIVNKILSQIKNLLL